MRSLVFPIRSRVATLMGVCALALLQTACAHPMVVQPQVAVQARWGGPVYGSVYAGPMYGPAPVVVAPQPVWMPPPAVVMAPRVMLTPPAHYAPSHHHGHGHGQGFNHGWSRRHW